MIRRKGGRRRHVAGGGQGENGTGGRAESSGSGRGAKNAVRSRSGREVRRKCRFAGKNREDCKRNENVRKYETDVPARRKRGADDSPSLVSERRFRKSKKDEGCRCCEKQKNAGKGRKRKAIGSKELERAETFEKKDAIRGLRFGGREGVVAQEVACGEKEKGRRRANKKRMRAPGVCERTKKGVRLRFCTKRTGRMRVFVLFRTVFSFENSFFTGQGPFSQDKKANKRRRIVFFGWKGVGRKSPCAFGSEGVLGACSRLRIKTRRPPRRGAVGRRKAALRGAYAGEEGRAAAREQERRGAKRKTRR